MPVLRLDGRRAYDTGDDDCCDEFNLGPHLRHSPDPVQTSSYVQVRPGAPFEILVYKYPGVPDEDFEVKCWVDGQPTEAKVWLNKTQRGDPAGWTDSVLHVSSQFVKRGRETWRVPLVFDRDLGTKGDTESNGIKVHLTAGVFRKRRAPPDESTIAQLHNRRDLGDRAYGREERYSLITPDGRRPAPWHEFVLKTRTKEQLVALGIIPSGFSVDETTDIIQSTQNSLAALTQESLGTTTTSESTQQSSPLSPRRSTPLFLPSSSLGPPENVTTRKSTEASATESQQPNTPARVGDRPETKSGDPESPHRRVRAHSCQDGHRKPANRVAPSMGRAQSAAGRKHPYMYTGRKRLPAVTCPTGPVRSTRPVPVELAVSQSSSSLFLSSQTRYDGHTKRSGEGSESDIDGDI